MKSFKFLLLSIVFFNSFNVAFAISSGKVLINSNNDTQLNKAIADKIKNLTDDLETIEINTTNITRCSENNMVFLNRDAENVDIDGCFDPTNAVLSVNTAYPTLAGSTPAIKLSVGEPNHPRFKVDNTCDTTVNTKSRAMTFNDLKYVYQSLHVPAYTGLTNIWLFDARKSASPTDPTTNCTALTIDNTVPANPIFVQTELPCSQANVSLVCVYN